MGKKHKSIRDFPIYILNIKCTFEKWLETLEALQSNIVICLIFENSKYIDNQKFKKINMYFK